MSIKFFDEKVFFDGLDFNTKDELLEFITNELVKLERIENPQRILQKFHKRENEVQTFLGSHFAIPHLKSTKVLENTIVFVRLNNSIPWNENGDKVKYIFAVLVKTRHEDLHIDILMSISRNIINSEKAKLLKTSKNIEELTEIINTLY